MYLWNFREHLVFITVPTGTGVIRQEEKSAAVSLGPESGSAPGVIRQGQNLACGPSTCHSFVNKLNPRTCMAY